MSGTGLPFQPLTFKDLAKGIDQRSSENAVGDGYAEDLQNVDTNSDGSLSKRPGYQGFAGYIPFRVREITHNGYQIIFRLASGINLTGLAPGPLLVYGKLPDAESGDISTTDVLRYYPHFSTDVRTVITTPSGTVTVTQGQHGLSTTDMFIDILLSTSETDGSNSFFYPDAIRIEDGTSVTPYQVEIDYSATSATRAYIIITDKSTDIGSSYVDDRKFAAIAPVAGVVTSTIAAGVHQLNNYQIIPFFYDYNGVTTYNRFIPDSLTINGTTGLVTYSFAAASNFDGKVILSSVPTTNAIETTVLPGETKLISIPLTAGDNFPYVAVYDRSGTTRTLVIPDAISVDDATDTMTVTYTNGSVSSKTVDIYWEFAEILTNQIKVVDTSATSTTYTPATVTDPQITLWGISHIGKYGVDSRAGHTVHIDSYKREGEQRLVTGLGGAFFAERSLDEVGTTYGLPTLQTSLAARNGSSTRNMCPLFRVTGTSDVRTRGTITGDDVDATGAIVTAASYVSSGVVDYTVSLTNKSGTLLLSNSNAPSLGSAHVFTSDYFTVAGMGYDQHNGIFKILSITDAVSSAVFRVTNSDVTHGRYDETGSLGRGNVYTDRITTDANYNYIPGDSVMFDGLADDIVLTVTSVVATDITVSGVTEEVDVAGNIALFAERSAYTVPLKNANFNPSVTDLVIGDMLAVTDLDRETRAVAVHGYQDMAATITVSAGTATASIGTSTTISSINTGTDTITTSTAHGLTSNDPVQLMTTDELPDGLDSNSAYFASVLSSTTLKLLASESGAVINLTTAGSGTLAIFRIHALSVGRKVVIAQTGDPLLDGEQTVVTVPSATSFTYTTTSTTSSATGVLVGKVVELDEQLTVQDSFSNPTIFTVPRRWIPIEAPTTAFDLPAKTHVTYYDSTNIIRSTIFGGSMYFLNQDDEVMKFDGTNVYRAGLFRWQPQLFVQVDTTVASIPASAVSASFASTAGSNKLIGALGDEAQFTAGDIVTFNSLTYTIQSTDKNAANGLLYFTTTVPSTTTAAVALVDAYTYYFRLNAIDANNNIVASAACGADDMVVYLTASGQIKHKLVGMPTFDIYDYDRIELQEYRTLANTASPFYLIQTVPVSFDNAEGYIEITDATTDDYLEEVLVFDDTMRALVGNATLGTRWDQPPRAKYITSAGNSLILSNLQGYPKLDIVIRKLATGTSITPSNLNTFVWLFRKDSADTLTAPNMLDRAAYEYVSTGSVAIVPLTDITRTLTTATVTSVAHGLAVGHWVYLFHAAEGTVNNLEFAGWYQVSAVSDADHFSFHQNATAAFVASATHVDRWVKAPTSGLNVPVWLGTDGNHNESFGNTTASYEFHAALRLAAAINASMRVTDVTISGYEAFVPWIVADAGSEFLSGQVIVKQPRADSDTFEVKLGTIGSAYDIFVNDIERISAEEIAATTLLGPASVVVSYKNYPEIFDNPEALVETDSQSLVQVEPANGEEITGSIPFFGESTTAVSQLEGVVVVPKTNSIYLMDVSRRSAGFPLTKLETEGQGCTAPLSLAPTKGGIGFANNSGVYRLNRDMSITYMGKYIERIWKDLVNRDALQYVTGHHYSLGRQYKLSVPISDGTVNSRVLVYDHTREGDDSPLGAWTQYTNHSATGWANLGNDAFFATTDGQVFKIRVANDATDYRDDADAVAQMVIKPKAMDAGVPGLRKVILSIVSHFRMDKSSMTATELAAAIDLETVFSSAGTIEVTLSTKKVQSVRSSLPVRRFEFLQLLYTNSVKDEEVILAGIDFHLAAIPEKGIPEKAEVS